VSRKGAHAGVAAGVADDRGGEDAPIARSDAFSGRCGGYLVLVELEEVVGGGDQSLELELIEALL
jgi:hypothetical protein